MQTHAIYLSLGTVPWFTIEDTVKLARACGFAGVEVLPTRKIVKELNESDQGVIPSNAVYTAHQSWRLDIGHDHSYSIPIITSTWYTFLRYLFFPNIENSHKALTRLSNKFHIPVTVHDISSEWTLDSDGKEFSGGINLEILEDKKITKMSLKNWLKNKKHMVVVDSRDDQSLRWATYNGFQKFTDFWTWIGLEKIHSIQLTLIGKNGIKNIFDHRISLAETELLWLHQKKWEGSVIIEVNPLILFLETQGNVKKGLQIIASFVVTVLSKGERWSTEDD